MKKKKMLARATAGGIVTTFLIASSHGASAATTQSASTQSLSQANHPPSISRSVDNKTDKDFYSTLAEQGFSPSQIHKISHAAKGKSKLY